MELLANTSQLFSTLKKQKVSNFDAKVAPTVSDTPMMSRDAKALEFQLNTHLRLKYKQQTRVTLKGDGSMGTDEVDSLMQSFTEKKNAKRKTWKSLALYEKWRLIQDYVHAKETDNEQQGHLREYQSSLRDHTLDTKFKVEYDHETHKIIDIKLI